MAISTPSVCAPALPCASHHVTAASTTSACAHPRTRAHPTSDGGGGRVIAYDKDEKRLARLRANAERTGASGIIVAHACDFLSVDPDGPEGVALFTPAGGTDDAPLGRRYIGVLCRWLLSSSRTTSLQAHMSVGVRKGSRQYDAQTDPSSRSVRERSAHTQQKVCASLVV
eukprot:364898-Chlamydomonas_euryale.AAC.3